MGEEIDWGIQDGEEETSARRIVDSEFDREDYFDRTVLKISKRNARLRRASKPILIGSS